jgi:tetratricopeptide (TPR) repeat protein/tRNA A-37 threonylcarbamoyl transferase component Bud32
MNETGRDAQLDEILAAYLEATGAGWAPDRAHLLRCYPHLADDLNRFFAGQDAVDDAATALRAETPRPKPGLAATLGCPVVDPPAAGGVPQVPGYDVHQEVGRGGMGVVYKARHRTLGRVVALKLMIAGAHAAEADRNRFRAEATAVARLNHPNVVQIHEIGEHAGIPYLALEFCDGGSLADKLGGTPLPPRDAAGLVAALARGVVAVHEKGVVHRDLKPANVLLTKDGTPKVTDFGLAKDLDSDARTGTGAVVGTPSYMAPEQAAARRDKVGPASDVYALGAILYECLTGRPPFKGPTPMDTLWQVMHDEPVPPAEMQPNVPRDLETICLKCLQKEPAKRYGGAAELADDLARYLAGGPIRARRVGSGERLWKWARRNPSVAGLAGAVGVLLLLVGAMSSYFVWNTLAKAEAARLDAAEKNREAENLRRRDGARKDLEEFRRLAGVHHSHAQHVALAGVELYYDPDRGRTAAEEAIVLAERLGPELDALHMDAERAALDRELHDLLLQTVQAQTRRPPARDAVPQILERLDRAASLEGPSRSSHRLRARCYRAIGEGERADEEERQGQAATPTALDLFFQAEDFHNRAVDLAETSGDILSWRPNHDLLRQAVAEYQSAIRLDSGNFSCYLQLGQCYLGLRRGPEAVEALSACVALRPDDPWGYSVRGLVLGLVDRYAEGEADLERALALAPDFRPARLYRGLLAWLQQKDEQALEDFAAVLSPPEGQRLIEAAYYRGLLRLKRKQYTEALKDFDLVVSTNPRFRPLFLTRAEVRFRNGDQERGRADLTTYLDLARPTPLAPKDPALFAQRGRLLLQLVPRWGLAGKDFRTILRLALEELETARKGGDTTAELFDDLGSVAERLGEFPKALDAYEQALKLNGPASLAAKVHTKLGWLHIQFPQPTRFDRARDEFSAALRLEPARAEAHTGLGYVQALQGAFSEGQREAALALLSAAGDYLVLHNVACIYAELSRHDTDRKKQCEDVAMEILRRADRLCRQGGEGTREIELMKVETSFQGLRARADWQALVGR